VIGVASPWMGAVGRDISVAFVSAGKVRASVPRRARKAAGPPGGPSAALASKASALAAGPRPPAMLPVRAAARDSVDTAENLTVYSATGQAAPSQVAISRVGEGRCRKLPWT
jgi:hypothetical protein